MTTVERDLGAGVRAGGFLAGCGAVLGAAVAGDWVSLTFTLSDFLQLAWPFLVGSVMLTAFERTQARRPLAKRLSAAASALVSAIFVFVSVMYAVWVAKQ